MDLLGALSVMTTPALVAGRSDAPLAAKVQEQLDALAAQPGKTVPTKPVTPIPTMKQGLMIRPIEAMLHLARATRPLITDDVYDWYRHWSWLRYLGVFDRAADGSLQLSDAGRRVRANQRRVLSEELGVGFGIAVAHHWCRTLGATGAITTSDIDILLSEGLKLGAAPRVSISARGRQPDYLLTYSAAGAIAYKSLECKGAATMTNVIGQLTRAATQLASLRVDGSTTPQGIAVATISSRSGVRFLALDPDDEDTPGTVGAGGEDGQDQGDDETRDRGPGKELEHVPGRPVTIADAQLSEVRDAAVRSSRDLDAVLQSELASVSEERLVREAVRLGMGTLADYAGNSDGAAVFLPDATINRLARTLRPRSSESTPQGTFRGVEYEFPTPMGQQISVFMGVAEGVDDALSAGEIEGVRAAQERFAAQQPPPTDVLQSRGLEAVRVGESGASATSSDGAILILRPQRSAARSRS